MDVFKIIQELYREKLRLERIIESLEGMEDRPAQAGAPAGRRGRKSMNAEERREVSQRMKAYWAARRAAKGGGPPKGGPAAKAS